MLGYMTKARAKAEGFTNDGRYMGIPVWLDMRDADFPGLTAKWAPMGMLLPVIDHICATLWPLVHPGETFMFTIAVGPKL